MTEIETYTDNLNSFLTEIQGSFVEEITFNIDSRPTFDKASLPFDFHYCFSIFFTTEKGNYSLRTVMTNSSIDTFWIEPVEISEIDGLTKPVQSKVTSVSCKNGYDGLAYKISIEFEDFAFIIFAAELYDTESDEYDYKMNDEMLLVFDNKNEAKKFEVAANYA